MFIFSILWFIIKVLLFATFFIVPVVNVLLLRKALSEGLLTNREISDDIGIILLVGLCPVVNYLGLGTLLFIVYEEWIEDNVLDEDGELDFKKLLKVSEKDIDKY